MRLPNDKLEWKTALEKEATERRADIDKIRADTEKLAERMSEMESKGISATAQITMSAPRNADQWTAEHIRVGGWNTDITNEENIHAMERILMRLLSHIRGRHLQPYTPKKDQCGVLNIRWENQLVAAQASFAVAQKMQISSPEDKLMDPERKWWCAVERHPIQNMRRRDLTAAKKMREELPGYKFHGNIKDVNVYMNNIASLKTESEAKFTHTRLV